MKNILKKIKLRFEPGEEKIFLKYHYEKSVKVSRAALIIGAILYIFFGFLDPYMVPVSINKIWFLRYVLVSPMILMVFALSFTVFFKDHMQAILTVSGTIFGLGLVAIVAVIHFFEPGFYFYYIGIILFIIWIHTLARILVKYSLISTSIVIGAYLFVIFFYKDYEDLSPNLILGNLFFLFGANIISTCAGYIIEYYMRKDYLFWKLRNAEDENWKRDIKRATLIQRSIIPGNKVLENKLVSISGRYLPMVNVGGDFYDCISLEDGKFIVIIADVSGHGVPAALISSMLKVSFHSCSHLARHPEKLLETINRDICGKVGNNFITAAAVYCDLKQKKARIAIAGHPPVIIYKRNNKELMEYKPGGMLLGFNPDLSIECIEVDIDSDQRIFLYTDGLIELITSQNHNDYELKIKELLNEVCNDSCEDSLNRILKKLRLDINNPADDITMVLIDIA